MTSQSLFQIQKHIPVCESSNAYLKQFLVPKFDDVNIFIRTDYQTNGKGQGDNFWESENGKNMLVSFLFYPSNLNASNQFYLSKWIAISIINLLSLYLQREKLYIKWPNDIYYENKKIAGILIENSVMGNNIQKSIIGIGLNVNQNDFKSSAPNPISLYQILKNEISVQEISDRLIGILNKVDDFSVLNFLENLDNSYIKKLYWKGEKHLFRIGNRNQEAVILGIDDYGFLKLLVNTKIQVFDIKEVIYIR